MERRSNISSSGLYVCYNKKKKKKAWEASTTYASYAGEDEDEEERRRMTAMMMMTGTWPPRSYRCSFCKREFRSAQALGGHMNVHRRDRAQLRQQSLIDNPTTTYTACINLNLPPPCPTCTPNIPIKGIATEFTGLDLEMNIHQAAAAAVFNKDLDLELRLGCN